jgi:hypothetical protein
MLGVGQAMCGEVLLCADAVSATVLRIDFNLHNVSVIVIVIEEKAPDYRGLSVCSN